MTGELKKKIERDEEFQLVKKIAAGTTSVVYFALRTQRNPLFDSSSSNSQSVALKVVPFANSSSTKQIFKREVKALAVLTQRPPLLNNQLVDNLQVNSIENSSQMSSERNDGNGIQKGIVKMFSHNYFEFNGEQFGVIEMELMEMDLMDYIQQHKKIDENQSRFVFNRICHAIIQSHSVGYYHLDLKPDNILISLLNNNNNDANCSNNNDLNSIQNHQSNNNNNSTIFPTIIEVKLGDFGNSMRKWKTYREISTMRASIEYLPMEIFHPEYSIIPEKIDIWSLGVILYVMLTGVYPYVYSYSSPIAAHFLGFEFLNDYCSRDCINLLKQILNINPAQRPTLQEILNHPWSKLPTSF